MPSEFFVLTATGIDLEQRNKPIAVFLAERNKMSVTSSNEETLENWRRYFNDDFYWKVHAKSRTPLSSLFSNSTYISGEFSPYAANTSQKYRAAVKAAGGKTVVFRPKDT
jgi:hypothetical protein